MWASAQENEQQDLRSNPFEYDDEEEDHLFSLFRSKRTPNVYKTKRSSAHREFVDSPKNEFTSAESPDRWARNQSDSPISTHHPSYRTKEIKIVNRHERDYLVEDRSNDDDDWYIDDFDQTSRDFAKSRTPNVHTAATAAVTTVLNNGRQSETRPAPPLMHEEKVRMRCEADLKNLVAETWKQLCTQEAHVKIFHKKLRERLLKVHKAKEDRIRLKEATQQAIDAEKDVQRQEAWAKRLKVKHQRQMAALARVAAPFRNHESRGKWIKGPVIGPGPSPTVPLVDTPPPASLSELYVHGFGTTTRTYQFPQSATRIARQIAPPDSLAVPIRSGGASIAHFDTNKTPRLSVTGIGSGNETHDGDRNSGVDLERNLRARTSRHERLFGSSRTNRSSHAKTTARHSDATSRGLFVPDDLWTAHTIHPTSRIR